MADSSLVANIVVPIVSVVGAGYLSFRVAKWQISQAFRDAEYRRAYDVVKDAADQYLEWLVLLRHLVDPFDRRQLGGREDAAKLGAVPQYLAIIDQLDEGKDAGQRLVDSLDDARYHLRVVDDAFLNVMRSLVNSVFDHWRTLMQTRPDERQRGLDTLNWIMARDALERGPLEAAEVFRAETIVGDLRYKLHREHNRRLLGAKAVDEYVRPGPLALRSGRLVYDGPISFESADYMARKDLPPRELQAQAGSPGT